MVRRSITGELDGMAQDDYSKQPTIYVGNPDRQRSWIVWLLIAIAIAATAGVSIRRAAPKSKVAPNKAEIPPDTRLKNLGKTELTQLQPLQPVKSPDELLSEKFDAAKRSYDALMLLQAALDERSKAAGRDADLRMVITLCERLIAKWPEEYFAVQARELIARCHFCNGNEKTGLERFLDYANSKVEHQLTLESNKKLPPDEIERLKERTFCDCIQIEADRRSLRKDQLGAIEYHNIVIAEYPESKSADHARLEIVRILQDMGRTKEATELLRKVIAGTKDLDITWRAYLDLSNTLFFSGKRDEAYAVLDELLQRMQTEDVAARVLFLKASFDDAKGDIKEAIAKYEELIAKYPNHQYVVNSKQMIEINRQRKPAKPPTAPQKKEEGK